MIFLSYKCFFEESSRLDHGCIFDQLCYPPLSENLTQLSVIIASSLSGICLDVTEKVRVLAEFPFAGECISMCGDDSFMYVVFKDYIEVYTSKNLRTEYCFGSHSPKSDPVTKSVPSFLVELWSNQPIFMCGRQNFFSLTKLERSKRGNDPILMQSVCSVSTFGEGKSVSTVYCLMKETVIECCQAMLFRAESLKVPFSIIPLNPMHFLLSVLKFPNCSIPT